MAAASAPLMRALRGLLNAGVAAAALFGPAMATAQPSPPERHDAARALGAPTGATGPTGNGAAPAHPEAHEAGPAPDHAEGHDAAPARDISLHGDKLTVRVTDVQVDEVLKTIAAPSNAEIKGAVK